LKWKSSGGLPAKHANDTKGDEDSETGKRETLGYHEIHERHERGRIQMTGNGGDEAWLTEHTENTENTEKFGGERFGIREAENGEFARETRE